MLVIYNILYDVSLLRHMCLYMYTARARVRVNKICSGEPKRKRFLAPRQIENYDIVHIYIYSVRDVYVI